MRKDRAKSESEKKPRIVCKDNGRSGESSPRAGSFVAARGLGRLQKSLLAGYGESTRLNTDLKQIACVSPPSIIFSSRLNNLKPRLFALFLKFSSNVSAHLEEFMCYDCRFSLLL